LLIITIYNKKIKVNKLFIVYYDNNYIYKGYESKIVNICSKLSNI